VGGGRRGGAEGVSDNSPTESPKVPRYRASKRKRKQENENPMKSKINIKQKSNPQSNNNKLKLDRNRSEGSTCFHMNIHTHPIISSHIPICVLNGGWWQFEFQGSVTNESVAFIQSEAASEMEHVMISKNYLSHSRGAESRNVAYFGHYSLRSNI